MEVFIVFASKGEAQGMQIPKKTTYTLITDLNHMLLNDLYSAHVRKQNEKL